MNLIECLPHSQKHFDCDEAIRILRRKLGAAFPYFLNDLLLKSSWEIVKLYPLEGLTAVRVTMLRTFICEPRLTLKPRYRHYEMDQQHSHLQIVYCATEETKQSAA